MAVGLLPNVIARPLARIEPFGIFILLGAMFLLPMLGRNLNMDLNIFSWLIGRPAEIIMDWIVALAGLQ